MARTTRSKADDQAPAMTEGTMLDGIRRKVFLDRYALKGEDGTALEQYPEQMWRRVARGIAAVEPTPDKRTEWEEKFYELLKDFKFVPGGRILSGAGTGHQVTYYNCYVVGLGENPLDPEAPAKPMLDPAAARPAFFSALAQMTDIMSRSGGVGMNLSALPPKGTPIEATGRGRRGAVRPTVALNLSHPDVERLIEEKDGPNLANVDVAVIVPPEFDQALADDGEWTPRWGQMSGPTVRAREMWARLTEGAGRPITLLRPGTATHVLDDSRDSIVEGAALAAESIFHGDAPIVDFTELRPKGAYIKTVNGTSSGPVAWMYLYDAVARSDDGLSPVEKGVIWFAEIASVITGKTIQQGGCFGPDQRIVTNKGLVRAAELAERIEAGESFSALTHAGLRPITYSFRNGIKPLFRVTTTRGFTVDVTAEHKMGVLRNGALTTIPLHELEIGDEVLLYLGEKVDATYVALDTAPYERSIMSTRLNEAVRLPDTLDEKLAYFLGYLHGDGYVYWGRKVTWQAPKAIKLATADAYPAIRDQLVTYARDLFGVEPVVEERPGEACKSVSLYSRVLIDWLRHNGLLKAHSKDVRVPEAIFRSPSSVMGAFVAGYFDADGCDRGRKNGYGFDSVSLSMLRDVQQLLAANGILSHIHTTNRSAQGWQTIHRLVVTGAEFKERMNLFMHMAGKNRGHAGFRNHHNGYSRDVWPQLGIPGRFYQRLWDSTKPRISYRALSRVQGRLVVAGEIALAERVSQLLHTVPDHIVSIEPLGPNDVYDFEVDDVHMLSGNGIYTSNSRRGALMIMLDDDHPDVEEFIAAKRIDPVTKRPVMIEHANMSLCISDAFMEAVKADLPWDLKWQGRVVRTVRARDIWDRICAAAWSTAEPGVVFMQRYQERSNTWYWENIRCVNPCGEQGLPPGGVCNLGALNVACYVDEDGHLMEDDLARDAAWATRFLDDVIDATPYFSELHVKMQREMTRRTGLGTMGLADALIKMRVAYGSAESLEVIDRIYRTIRDASYRASVELAEEKEPCGGWRKDPEKYAQGWFITRSPQDVQAGIRAHGIRNGVLLTQAPTGTTSLLAGVSSGIEPVYDFAMKRVDRLGEHIMYHPLLQDWMDEHPGEERPAYFVGAKDLTPEEHILVQAKVQEYTDSSISKTSNAPYDHTVEDVKRLYTLAYDLGCKGVTYYRDGSRDAVLTSVAESKAAEAPRAEAAPAHIVAEAPAPASAAVPPPAASSAAQAPLPQIVAAPSMPAWMLEGRLKRRPKEMGGFTRSVAAPEGTVNITINSDADGPLEVFINVGRAGSDIAALAEALGRLISLQLRLPSTMSQEERLRQVANQLRGIGGSRSIGFGVNRVLSLPDAVARAIYHHLEEHPATASHPEPAVPAAQLALPVSETLPAPAAPATGPFAPSVSSVPTSTSGATSASAMGTPVNGKAQGKAELMQSTARPVLTGNLCPQCGSGGAYVYEEGCKKCHYCGYSEC